VRVLLVSTYELGHQPLHLASPAATLVGAGHEVRTIDISVEDWDDDLADWADAVAFSVPMHTAMRLALEGAAAVKARDRKKPVCLYGLYATVGGSDVDHVIAGEYEASLLGFLEGTGGVHVDLRRRRTALPLRGSLPALDRYARLRVGGEERLAGYVEASHGCAHRCRHCPVPVVYDGRTRRVDADIVLDDVAQLVDAGARHITFGDPDFLNRWAHSMRIVEEFAARFPQITYDITTKVSHLVQHADLMPTLARTGCLFVVSAFECTNDRILGYLDKGHTSAEASHVTRELRSHGIEVRPSWLPFMPWTTVADVADILDFVVEHDLIGNVDPVQYTIKLLIPRGSLMLDVPEIVPYLGGYDAASLSYAWTAADPATVDLQRELADLVEAEPGLEVFANVDAAVRAAMGASPRDIVLDDGARGRPRLTEPWFCCAEPTKDQFGSFVPSGSKEAHS
jgi:radical SAM superfamily enzyme YgiQ (UPF0313 family)